MKDVIEALVRCITTTNQPISNSHSQGGNAAFFMVIAIPVVLSLTVIGIDFTAYQTFRAVSQQEIDRIALQAAQVLPQIDLAQGIVRRELARLPDLSLARSERGDEILTTTGGRLKFAVQGEHTPSFASFIPTEDPIAFRFVQSTGAAAVPLDLVIVLPDGNSLRPAAREFWGQPNTWKASKYFNLVTNPRVDDNSHLAEPIYWPQWDQRWSDYSRWATQHCFNPVLSNIKLTAVAISDILGAPLQNRVSLIYTPGDNTPEGFQVARPLLFPKVERTQEIRRLDYFEGESFTGDELCSYIASSNISNEQIYTLPEAPPGFGIPSMLSTCDELSQVGIWGNIHFPKNRVPPSCFGASLSVRNAIYYRSARRDAPSEGAVLRALGAAHNQFISASTELATARRGNLKVAPRRQILLVTDRLPGVSPTFIDQIEGYKIRLTIVAMQHPWLPETAAASLENRLQEWSLASPRVKGFIITEPDNLREKLLPFLTGSGNHYVVAN